MPQLDFTTYASQIFWLVITFGILYLTMARAALPTVREVLQNRQTRITEDLKKAEKLKEDAQAAEADFTSALSEARSKASTMLAGVREKAAKESEARNAKMDETFTRQAKEAEKRVATIRRETVEKLTPITVEAAQEMVQKLINVTVDTKKVEQAVAQMTPFSD